MKNQKLQIYYDIEEDILEIRLGDHDEVYFDEIEDDVFEGHSEKTGELTGYKIFNFKKRGGMKNITIQLPAHVNISA